MSKIRKFCFIIFAVLTCLNSKAQSLSIIWPKQNEVISDRSPLLSWNGMEGVSSYQISLSLDSTFSSGVQQFSSSIASYQLTTNLASGTWFWKINATINGQSVSSNLVKFQLFEPTDIADLKIWYNAENVLTNGSNISQLTDLSGNNIHAIQNTASLQPSLINNAINGKPTIKFFDDQLNTSSFNSSYRSEFFMLKRNGNPNGSFHGIVIQPNPPYNQIFIPSSNHIFNSYIGSTAINTNTIFDLNQYILISRSIEPSTTRFRKNAQLTSTNSITAIGTINDMLMLGGVNNSNNFFNGAMSEYLFYNRVLSVSEQSIVEKYIMDKYAPPINLGTDITPTYQNNGSCFNEIISAPSMYNNYTWSTGATSQSIQVSQPGSYWVQTTDIFGRTSRDTIVVNNPKMNIFNFQDTIVCFNDTLSILPSIPLNHSFTQWKDGNLNINRVFSLVDANHFYSVLFTSNSSCMVESNQFQIKIDSSLQNINLGADTAVCSNNFIQVSNTPSIPLTYLWNTNNTNSSQIIQVSGQYWVQVTNANGCSNSDTIAVTISGEGPIVNTIIPSSTCVGASIELAAQGTISAPESISSYSWNFGNGFTSTGVSFSTIYNSTGSKQIQLTVTASNGCEVILNQAIQVFPNPTVNILSTGSCIYDTVSFSTQNNGFNIQNYSWDLGQNVTSISPTPNHVYNASGSFPITVIASDQNGCIDTSGIQLMLTENLENYSNLISIIWPKSNEVISDRTPLLSWNGVDGVSTYQVSISLDSTFNSGVQQFSSSNSTYQLPNNLVSGAWFWKVNTVLNGQNLVSNLGKFQVFEPTDIADLKIWYNAENVITNGTNISQLTDLSGNNIHAIQNTTSLQPSLIDHVINGKPTIKFFDDQLNTSTFNSTYRSEFFMLKRNGNPNGSYHSVIIQPNPPYNQIFIPSSNHIFNSYIGSTAINTNTIFDLNQYILISRSIEPSTTKFRKNAQLTSTNSISAIGSFNDALMIGGFNNGQFFNGEMPEYLFYNRILTSVEQSVVEKYIMDKYAPPVNLGADITPIYQNNGGCVNELITASSMYTTFLWSTGATTQSIQVTQPGSYWVQTIDIFGRTSRDTIVVNNPKMSIFSDVEFECYNGPSFLTANIPQNHSFIKWNNCNPNITNQVHSGNNYFVEFQNQQGCLIKSNLFSVEIDSTLATLSLGSDTSLCSGNNIQLQNAPAGITDYAWNTGNSQAIQAVDTTGQYVLEVTNTNNCQNRDTIEVTIIGTSPNLQFDFSDTLCQFSQGSFSDNSFIPNNNGTISTKTWSISEGTTLSGSFGNFSIDTSGTFNVTLLVETVEGCSSSATFPLVVYPKPIVSFTTEKFCPYDAVEFIPLNSINNPLTSTLWNFYDNTTSTSPNPTHVFGITGTYNVSLQAQDINGCRDTVVQAVYIQPAPLADFAFTNTCELSAVNFVNNSNIADTFSVITNQWTYGDGTSSTNPAIQKVYQGYGEYDVQLVVTANNGCQDTLSQTITIHPKPILGWQVGPACKNTWTTFEDQSTIPLGSIVQTDWLVNLQYPFEGPSSEFLFVTTGEQYLNLTSTSDQGCSTDTLIIVNVQPEINAAYTISPSNVVAGISPVFTSTSIGASSYEWIFGFGNTEQTVTNDAVVAPPYPASSIGDTIITLLIIENDLGCKDTAYQYVKINEPRIDLALNQLFAEEINGYLKIGIELKNQGFIEITQTDLVLSILNSSPILETETEPLAPGESRVYLFNSNPSAFISTQDNEISYVCVEATSYNDYQLIETELNNNISCINREGGNFVLLPIHPNPTNNDITYTLIVSEESSFSISLTDEAGRIVQSSTELLNPGLHTPILSMRNLSAGVYYFQISDGITSKTVKVLKN